MKIYYYIYREVANRSFDTISTTYTINKIK